MKTVTIILKTLVSKKINVNLLTLTIIKWKENQTSYWKDQTVKKWAEMKVHLVNQYLLQLVLLNKVLWTKIKLKIMHILLIKNLHNIVVRSLVWYRKILKILRIYKTIRKILLEDYRDILMIKINICRIIILIHQKKN